MIPARIPNSLRRLIYKRDGYRCALCDDTRTLQIHHYVPRSRGGTNSPQNLICLCGACHAAAHGLDIRNIGFTRANAQQAVCEYLADLYAGEWLPDDVPQYWEDTPDDW